MKNFKCYNMETSVIIIISFLAVFVFCLIYGVIHICRKLIPGNKNVNYTTTGNLGTPTYALIPPLFFTDALEDPLVQNDLSENIRIPSP